VTAASTFALNTNFAPFAQKLARNVLSENGQI
jgi:hypothetical protein